MTLIENRLNDEPAAEVASKATAVRANLTV